jgi:hypothetical protein
VHRFLLALELGVSVRCFVCLCSDFSISCLGLGVVLPQGCVGIKLVQKHHLLNVLTCSHLFICFGICRSFWISKRPDRSLWGQTGAWP